jgi:hypothetical protein
MILELGLLLAIRTSYCLSPVASLPPPSPNRFVSALSATLNLNTFEVMIISMIL